MNWLWDEWLHFSRGDEAGHIVQVLTLAFVFCSILIVWKLYSRRAVGAKRLSRLVRRERKRLYKVRFRDRLYALLLDCYYPPKTLRLVLPLLCAWWLALFGLRVAPKSEDLLLITRLQQLEVGIAMVFVPLMIFAVGLSVRRSISGLNVAEVLLAKTYLFPIAMFILGLLGGFILLSNSTEAILSIGLTFVGVSFVLYRLCNTLLDDCYLHSAAVSLLQDKIRRSIGTAVDIRIGHSILLAELASTNIEYNPFTLHQSTARRLFVSSPRIGAVTDIDIDKLVLFSQNLATSAEKEGISFDAKQMRPQFSGANDDMPRIPALHHLRKVKPPSLIRILGDEIKDTTDNLLSFPREAVQDVRLRRRLVSLVQDAVVVRPRESNRQRVRKYMSAVKDDAILAIRDQRTAQLEDLLNVYISAGDTFLQEMAKLGGNSFDAALRERQNLLGSWAELDWITKDLLELHRRGCLSDDISVVQLAVSIPERLAHLTIQYGDHLVFDKITWFPVREYELQDEAADSRITRFLAEHSLRSLQELVDYGIVIELRRPNARVSSVESIGSLATTVLLRFQYLLKSALSKRRTDAFGECMRMVLSLLESLGRDTEDLGSADLDFVLEEDRISFGRALEKKRSLQKIVKDISAQKQQLLFSVGSLAFEWVNERNGQDLLPFLTDIDQHLSPASLAHLYLQICEPAAEDLWGNQLLDFPRGGGAGGSAQQMFARYFSFLLLKSVQTYSDTMIEEIRIPSSPELLNDLKEHGAIRNSLTEFGTQRDQWCRIVPDEWLQKLPKLYSLFEGLISAQRRKDEDHIISAPIEVAYLKQFKEKFLQTFVAEAGLRKVFELFKAYSDPSSDEVPGPQNHRWGANVLDIRESYIDGLRRSSVKWPEEYGRNLALSESEKVFHEVLARTPEGRGMQAGAALNKRIASLERELYEGGIAPDVMLIGGDCSFLYTEEWANEFTPDWSAKGTQFSRLPGFQGVLKMRNSEIPIVQVRTNQDSGIGCLLSLRSGILWRQYLPFDSDSEKEYRESFFFLRINITTL